MTPEEEIKSMSSWATLIFEPPEKLATPRRGPKENRGRPIGPSIRTPGISDQQAPTCPKCKIAPRIPVTNSYEYKGYCKACLKELNHMYHLKYQSAKRSRGKGGCSGS